MTKSEKIKDAFGKSWNLLAFSMQEHILNVHHWVDRSQNRMNLSPKDLGFDEKTECEVHCEFWRPVSLKGIEDNNGWTKIENEKDLPKAETECHFFDKTRGIIAGIFLPRNNGGDIDYILKNATHFRIVEKPEPPIY